MGQWPGATNFDPGLLAYRVSGGWWDVLEALDVTLLVTREYEHLAVGLTVEGGAPAVSYLPLPHPSGMAVDREAEVVHIASTRNPNQVLELRPVTGALERADVATSPAWGRPLLPVRSQFLPGALYIHDLAMVGGQLHANAVGMNAVIALAGGQEYHAVWWPKCTESNGAARFDRNYIQLNSIAAGPDLAGSYFSASATRVTARRPGHRNFAVNKRGAVFGGATRDVVISGLTRPHSARLYGERLWVDNSGYGELVASCPAFPGTGYDVVCRLPGWTRGLCFAKDFAFVGTSRVIPRFSQYAPGLELERSICGVHALDTRSGMVVGSIVWPEGNQVFGVEWLPRSMSAGFPYSARGLRRDPRAIFYAFQV